MAAQSTIAKAREGQRNLRQKNEEAYALCTTAMSASESLQNSTKALAAMISREDGSRADEHVRALLDKCEHDLIAGQVAHGALLDLIPPAYRKPARASGLAAQIFGMPEILEHILTYTSTRDILSAYSVSKTVQDTIEGSIKLQRALGLAADPASSFFLPAKSLMRVTDGVYVSTNAENAVYDGMVMQASHFEAIVNFEGNFDENLVSKLGERCAKMLVTQPPIKEMQVYIWCCSIRSQWGYRGTAIAAPSMTIASATGVTMGHVLEAVSRLRASHSLCPEARVADHDEQGFVRARLTIEGALALNDDDPLLQTKSFGQEAKANKAAREVLLQHYIGAKRSARANGQAIPTLAEFQKAQAVQQS